jgi:hypothetical protein
MLEVEMKRWGDGYWAQRKQREQDERQVYVPMPADLHALLQRRRSRSHQQETHHDHTDHSGA